MKAVNCPCCGYPTVAIEHEICPLCHWQNDPWQVEHPDDANGPNYVSLRQAQKNFLAIGKCDPRESESNRSIKELGLEGVKPRPAAI